MTIGQVIAKLGVDPKEYEKGLKKAEGQAKKAGSKIGGIFKQAFSFGLGMGLVSGFKSLGGAITDFVNTAARTDVLNVAMQSVAKASGYAITALREQKEAVMDLGIAEQEATQILTRFMQAQLNTADAAKLARVAQDAAVIAGYNSSQAAEQMTEAIAKLRPELLSAFGMTRNMNEIYSDYAKTIGKTTTQLVDAEKKQAILNYILKEGEKIAGTYEASMGVVGKQISSLPRYWDTLKNAIAKPLALPALSVIVEAVTNGLKNAIKWAETNVATLQKWGRTAADVAGFIIRAFKSVSQIFVRNWSVIQFAAVALLTYVTATKAATLATSLFQTVSLLLSGNLSAQSGILGFLNNVIIYYKVQMLGATATTNIFTAALYNLKAALYAVHTALGPVGWILIALSLLVAGGMALWNKYAQSMNEAWEASFAEKMRKQQEKLKDSTKGAAAAAEDQADALNEAGKAAAQNLQSFDEVHQLQEDMADVTGLDMPSLDPFELEGFDLLEIDFSETLEQQKATFAGFMQWIGDGFKNAWEWIKQGAGDLWDGVKEKWGKFTEWVKSWDVWEWINEKWKGVKIFAGDLWEGVKEKWARFEDWLGEWWGNSVKPWFTKERWLELFDNMKTGIQDKWNEIKNWWANTALVKWWDEHVSPWFTKQKWIELYQSMKDGIQEKWSEIKDWWENNAFSKWWRDNVSPWFTKEKWLGLYQNMKDSIQEKWAEIKDWWNSTALVKWWNEDVVPWFTKEKWANLYDNVKTSLQETWQGIKDWWNSTALVKWWNEDVVPWFTKEKWKGLYDNIKTSIQEKWNEVKDWWNSTALVKWWNEDVKPWFTWDKWKEVYSTIKDALKETWEEIKNSPIEWGKNLIENFTKGIKEKANSLKDSLKNVGKQIKNFLGFSSPTKEGPGRDADKWAPAFMDMYREGLTQGIPGLRSSVSTIADEMAGLASMTVQPAVRATASVGYMADSGMISDGIAQAVYRAIIDAFRIIQASSTGTSSGESKELVLKIDNTVLARMQLPAIIREGQRQGLNLVVQPQGV